MLSKNQLKLIRSLRLKKNRQTHRQFLVEGATVVGELLAQAPADVRLLACTKDYPSSLPSQVREQLGDRIAVCDEPLLASLSSLDTPSPVLALVDMPQPSSVEGKVRGLALFLDGIRDPGNLGTILRIADWFGLHSVLLADDCVDVYNPKTIQASMGSFRRVSTRVASLAAIRGHQPDLVFIGTSLDGGTELFDFAWPADGLLIVGSESHGIRPENLSAATTWVTVPRGPVREPGDCAESLNAAVCTGILCAAHLRSAG